MSTTKTHRLELRLTEEQNSLIRSAARHESRNISDFVLSAATLEAQRRLADQRLFLMDDEQYARFEEILQTPPSDDPKLRRLFERTSPFGTHINLTAPRTSDQ